MNNVIICPLSISSLRLTGLIKERLKSGNVCLAWIISSLPFVPLQLRYARASCVCAATQKEEESPDGPQEPHAAWVTSHHITSQPCVYTLTAGKTSLETFFWSSSLLLSLTSFSRSSGVYPLTACPGGDTDSTSPLVSSSWPTLCPSQLSMRVWGLESPPVRRSTPLWTGWSTGSQDPSGATLHITGLQFSRHNRNHKSWRRQENQKNQRNPERMKSSRRTWSWTARRTTPASLKRV